MGEGYRIRVKPRLALIVLLVLGAASCGNREASFGETAADAYEKRQRYWNGKVATIPPMPANAGKAECKAWRDSLMAMRRSSDEGRPGDAEYGRPELMAIGDSLYNGVQSLRVNWWLSEWSVPTLVAIRLGLVQEQAADRTGERSFYGPQYPTHDTRPNDTQDYGFSLESIPGLFQLFGFPNRQATALDELAFRYLPDNRRPLVENIAFSGANSHDLLYWTPADYRSRAEGNIASLRRGLLGAGSLADGFFNANAAFVLNPTRNPCLEHLSAIQQIELRHPRRLLISIGANDGMYGLAFSGTAVNALACSPKNANDRGEQGQARCVAKPIHEALLNDYINNIQVMLSRLAEVKGLETVYINSLPRPSRTANLVPTRRGDRILWANDFMSSTRRGLNRLDEKILLSNDEVKSADTLIDKVNAELRALVATMNLASPGTRFAVAEVDQRLGELDYKGCEAEFLPGAAQDRCRHDRRLVAPRARFRGSKDAYFDNRPIRFQGETGVRSGGGFRSKVTEGGLISFDNMHLSSIGYEIMADRVVGTMLRMNERGILPIYGSNRRELCVAEGEPGFERMRPGDCSSLLVSPGWVFNDATRRQFVFLRQAGLEETSDRLRLSARIGFVRSLVGFWQQGSDPQGID